MRTAGVVYLGLLIAAAGVFGTAASQVQYSGYHNLAPLSGRQWAAVAAAYRDWSKSVSKGRYNAADQTVYYGASGARIEVRILPKFDLRKPSRYGKEGIYIIDPLSGKIVSRLFGD